MARRSTRVLYLLLGGAYLGYVLSTLPTTAPTFDEVAHLPAGYAALRLRQPLLNLEHPPLAKLLAATPLTLVVAPDDTLSAAAHSMNEWDFGRLLLFQSGYSPDILMALGRLPMILLGLVLAVLAAHLASIWGRVAGISAFFMVAFCPILLAHARLVTTDVPLATFSLLATSLLVRHRSKMSGSDNNSSKAILGFGLALGSMLSTKYTAVVFIPALILADLLFLGRQSSPRDLRTLVRTLSLFWLPSLGLATGLAIGLYGWPPKITAWLHGFGQVGFNHVEGYPFYLLGEFSGEGFPFYFPIAFLLKSSPAILLLTLLSWYPAAAQLLCRPTRSSGKKSNLAGEAPAESDAALKPRPSDPHAPKSLEVTLWPFLLLPGGAYFLSVWLYAPEIGVRYLIPALPFLYIFLAVQVQRLTLSRAGRALCFTLALLHLFGAWQAWPDPLSYFNGLLGCGRSDREPCLDDSNLDWGQDLGRVSQALEALRAPTETVRLGYMGTSDPRFYLKRWQRVRPEELQAPEPALYVISAQWWLRHCPDPSAAPEWKPMGRVGNTFYLFDHRPPHVDRPQP